MGERDDDAIEVTHTAVKADDLGEFLRRRRAQLEGGPGNATRTGQRDVEPANDDDCDEGPPAA